MKTWKPLIILAAVVLSVVSIALPVAHWVSIPTDTSIKWLAGLTIFALALCKLAFFPLAWSHLIARRMTPAITLAAFAVFLLFISVDATRNLFEEQTQKRETKLVTQTYDYKQLQTEIEQLNQQIETQTTLQAKDVENHFRDRAIKQAKQLQSLKREREQKRLALVSASRTSASAVSAEFGISLGKGVSLDGGALAALSDGALVTALSIHIGCVVAVLACGVWSPNNPPEVVKPALEVTETDSRNQTRTSARRKPVSRPTQEGLNVTLDDDQRLLAERIIRGEFSEFSEAPGVKKIIQSGLIVGGHRRVKPIYDWLLQNNDIKKEGRGFQLIQTVIV